MQGTSSPTPLASQRGGLVGYVRLRRPGVRPRLLLCCSSHRSVALPTEGSTRTRITCPEDRLSGVVLLGGWPLASVISQHIGSARAW